MNGRHSLLNLQPRLGGLKLRFLFGPLHYGSTSASPEDGDMDVDSDVDLVDLASMLARYGEVCE